jgi:hypothetical protein
MYWVYGSKNRVHGILAHKVSEPSLNEGHWSVDQGLRLDGQRGILVSNPDRRSSERRLGGLLPH